MSQESGMVQQREIPDMPEADAVDAINWVLTMNGLETEKGLVQLLV